MCYLSGNILISFEEQEIEKAIVKCISMFVEIELFPNQYLSCFPEYTVLKEDLPVKQKHIQF